jgi:hypothetical protein
MSSSSVRTLLQDINHPKTPLIHSLFDLGYRSFIENTCWFKSVVGHESGRAQKGVVVRARLRREQSTLALLQSHKSRHLQRHRMEASESQNLFREFREVVERGPLLPPYAARRCDSGQLSVN